MTRLLPPTAPPATLAVWTAATLLAMVVPWVNPVTWGPTPEMVQSLLSAGCAAVLLVAWGRWGPRVGAGWLAGTLAWGWLLAALLSAGAGLLQYFGAEGVLPYGWINPATPGQAYANLRQRNQFASLTSLGLAALLYLLSQHRRTPSRPLALRNTGAVLAMALLALGNAASSSRTGVLQWLALLALAWLWARQGRRTLPGWALLAAGLYGLAAWALPLGLQSHTGQASLGALARFQENAGCGDRSVLWRNVLELVAHKPWLGWGWGELKFAHFITPYPGERFCELLDNAHNLPLHLAVELGLPAALLLCGGALAALLRARPWRDTDPARQMAWAGLAIIALHSLLEYPLWYGPFQLATVLCLWLLWRTRRGAPAGAHHPGWPGAEPLRLAVATAMLATVAWVGWDYWRVGQLFMPQALRAEAYREDTLAKVQDSWWFRDTVRFARVTTTPPSPDNAVALYADALQALHYSPEPRVIGTLLECARLLGQESASTAHIRRQWQVVYDRTDDGTPELLPN